MAVGQIIGRVSVKVMPQTNDFRKDAQRKLDAIEKSLKVEARVVVDDGRLKAEALRAVRDLNRTLRAGGDAYKVKFHAMISRSTMNAEIKKAQSVLEQKAKGNKIRFGADVAAAIVAAELDKDSLKIVKKELENFRDGMSPLKVHVTPHMTPGAGAAVSARLQALTRPRTVPITPTLDQTGFAKVMALLGGLSGGRVLKNYFKDFADGLKNLDKAVPMISGLTFGIIGLGGAAMASASNLFTLSSSLAQIGPAALALPGIFGGMLIGLAATVAVFKDFNTVLPGVGKHFSKLQDQMSSNFWAVAEGSIRNLIYGLFPQLAAGLRQTSTELGGFFANLSNSLNGQFDGALAGMFDDLSASIEIASRYTDAYATILRVLGEVGAGYLPQLAGWFVRLSDQFADFLSTAQADGSLTGWIDRGITQIQALGGVLAGLGRIFYGIATAAEAAGGSTLQTLDTKLQSIADTVNGDAFQNQLTGVFRAAHEAMGLIANTSGPAVSRFFDTFATTLQAVLPIAGASIGQLGKALFTALANPAIQSGFVSLVRGIAAGVAGLLPAFDAIAPAIGAVMSVIGALAANLGPVLGAAFTAIGPAVATVATALVPLINMLGPILTTVITALAPVIALIGEKLAEVAVAAQPLIAKIGELIAVVLPILVPALKILVSIIGGALIGVIGGAVQFITGLIQMFQGFINIVKGVIAIFKGDFSQGFAMIWEGVKAIFAGAFNMIVGGIRAWLFGSVLGVIRGGVTKLLGVWKGGWEGIKGAATAVWNAIKGVVTGGIAAVRGFVSRGVNTVRAVWVLGWNQVRAVLVNVWNTVKSTVSGALNAVRGFVSRGINTVKTLWSGGWNTVKSTVTTAAGQIKSGVQSLISQVTGFFSGLPGKIKSALGNLGALLYSQGQAIIQGLLDGIASIGSQVAGKVNDIVNSAKNGLKGLGGKLNPFGRMEISPRASNAAIAAGKKAGAGFRNLGKTLIGELNKGANASFDKFEAQLGRFTQGLPKGATKSLKATVTTGVANMRAIIQQFRDNAEGITNASESLTQAINDAENYRTAIIENIMGREGRILGSESAAFGGIKASLEKALGQTREFVSSIQKLGNMGLNDTYMDQLLDAGPEQALAYAQSIASSGQAGVDQINRLQTEIEAAAGQLGDLGSKFVMQDEVDVARAILTSLQNGKGPIVAEVRRLAQAMMTSINTAFNNGYAVTVETKKGGKKGGKGKGNKRTVIPPGGRPAAAARTAVNTALANTLAAKSAESNGNTLNYYAAPGRSLTAEEDLFEAAQRGRMVGWS